MTTTLPNLLAALQQANKVIFERKYIVVAKNEKAGLKEPVFLQLKYPDGNTRNIGITHLVHLKGSNWDDKPAEEIARTTAEVAKSIVNRIDLFFSSEARKFHIDENGTIFDFNKSRVEIYEDKTFAVNGRLVTYEKISALASKYIKVISPLLLTSIKSESVVEFRELQHGHINLFDAIDQRQGKGIFIDSVGKIYRA